MSEIKEIVYAINDRHGIPPDSGKGQAFGSSTYSQLLSIETSPTLPEALALNNIKFEYFIYRPTGDLVVNVVDNGTGKIIRQIPAKELLALTEAIQKEMESGLLLDLRI